MALHTPSNLYSGGAVVLNTMPAANLQMNLMARQEAKRDALEKYYNDLNSKMTTAGMDNKDVPILMQQEAQRQQYFKENREKILNPRLDGGKAQTDYQGLYQQSQSVIDQSKQKVQHNLKGIEMMMPLVKEGMLPDGALEMYANADKPLNEAKPFDFGTLLQAQKPIDYDKHLKETYAGIKRVPGTPQVTTDPNTLMTTTTTSQSFDDKGKQTIAALAASKYNSNAPYHRFINEQIKNEGLVNQVNDFSKEQFGHDVDVTHPEQFAAAYDLMRLQPTISETKPTGTNQNALADKRFAQEKERDATKFGYSKQLQDNAFSNQKELARWKKEKGLTEGKDEDAWADDYLDNLPTKEGTATYKAADGKTTKEKEVQADAVLLKSLSRSMDGHTVEPDRIYYNEDTKQYRPIFYDKKWNGSRMAPSESNGMASVNKELSQPISRDQMKLALGVKTMSKKQLAATMSSDEKPAQTGGGSWKSRAKKVN